MMRTDCNLLTECPWSPDFSQLLAVLRFEKPSRPVLFEYFLNERLHEALAGSRAGDRRDPLDAALVIARAYARAGYDYVMLVVPGFGFPYGHVERRATISINEGGLISDRKSFDAYPWPDPEKADYGFIDRLAAAIHPGQRIIINGPCGVLENAIRVVGYETLCMLMADDPALVGDVFEAIGKRIESYYKRALRHAAVGAVIGNDDWGFKSQTMLSPDAMRRLVLPWHRRLVAAAHAAGRPAILHSCGCLDSVWEDIVEDLRYDAKHSYEDSIEPVEQAYERLHRRVAVLGGIDVDFVCRATPEKVYRRALGMLERAAADGGYALGTGNSVPEYVPDEGYWAMVRAAYTVAGNAKRGG